MSQMRKFGSNNNKRLSKSQGWWMLMKTMTMLVLIMTNIWTKKSKSCFPVMFKVAFEFEKTYFWKVENLIESPGQISCLSHSLDYLQQKKREHKKYKFWTTLKTIQITILNIIFVSAACVIWDTLVNECGSMVLYSWKLWLWAKFRV